MTIEPNYQIQKAMDKLADVFDKMALAPGAKHVSGEAVLKSVAQGLRDVETLRELLK